MHMGTTCFVYTIGEMLEINLLVFAFTMTHLALIRALYRTHVSSFHGWLTPILE